MKELSHLPRERKSERGETCPGCTRGVWVCVWVCVDVGVVCGCAQSVFELMCIRVRECLSGCVFVCVSVHTSQCVRKRKVKTDFS